MLSIIQFIQRKERKKKSSGTLMCGGDFDVFYSAFSPLFHFCISDGQKKNTQRHDHHKKEGDEGVEGGSKGGSCTFLQGSHIYAQRSVLPLKTLPKKPTRKTSGFRDFCGSENLNGKNGICWLSFFGCSDPPLPKPMGLRGDGV